jgi:hypothetical protein
MERAPKRAKKDWRSKCIEKFGLLPAPEYWRDCSNERAWERYYHFRSLTQEQQYTPKRSPDDMEDFQDDDDDEESQHLRDELQQQMGKLQKEIFGLDREVLWDYSPWIGKDIHFKGYRRIRTVTHHAVVWSPFAIPHAIRLEHYYHHQFRAYSLEFRVSWSYRFFDFENEHFEASGKTELCSNTWNRVDMIRTGNLSARTAEQLRTFLFGSSFEASENFMDLADCEMSKSIMNLDDYSFLRLLFGSMATFHFDIEQNGDGFGHKWSPTEEEFQTMAREGALDGTYIEDPSDISVPWLSHRIKAITNSLTRVESYYRPPAISGDACWGYVSDGGMSEDEETSSWWPM